MSVTCKCLRYYCKHSTDSNIIAENCGRSWLKQNKYCVYCVLKKLLKNGQDQTVLMFVQI